MTSCGIQEIDDWASDVVSGRVVSCVHVQRAVARWHRDLDRSADEDFPYYFDAVEVRVRIEFCALCHHWKGEKAGTPFIPEPWQMWVIANIFGWKQKSDGYRRFRTAYLEVARKNGKTFLAAVIGLLCFFLDGEPGAELYCAATKKDQAKIAHRDAKEIIRKSPTLKKRTSIVANNISLGASSSKFEPVASDADSLDGLNVHMAIIDEYHAHKTQALYDVIDSATGARRQPLILTTTTAGFFLEGPCMQKRRTSEAILDPGSDIEDEEAFAVIFTLDDGDDWTDENNWLKSNPNYGISVFERDMRNAARQAKNSPTHLNEFLTRRLNVWCGQEKRWLDMDRWDLCCVQERAELSRFAGMTAYGGLDVSSKRDITALAWAIPDGDIIHAFLRYWVPCENARKREVDGRVPYETWGREGLVNLTDGGAIDQDAITEAIRRDSEIVKCSELAVDRWEAAHITNTLDAEGMNVCLYSQGAASMSPAAKELERLIYDQKLRVYGDPVLRWMVSNTAVKTGPTGLIQPDKARSGDKIDGVVALCMAVALAAAHVDNASVYQKRGLLSV